MTSVQAPVRRFYEIVDLDMSEERYERQRLIHGWDQERLSKARVLVAGAGALGNEVAKNLTLLGIGHLLLVDFDLIETVNLSRTVLFTDSDVGKTKVEAMAVALKRINPQVAVQTINGNLFYDVGLGHYRHSDLVIGCLDNLAARSQVGMSCSLANVPYLDGGMWAMGGEVRWFDAGNGPCFDCTLDDVDRQRAHERRSCTGFGGNLSKYDAIVPTVATTAAIIGGMMAQEAAKYLNGLPVEMGKALVYNGQALTLHRAELTRNLDCPNSHEPYLKITQLPCGAAELTSRRLFELVRSEEMNKINDGQQDPLLLELGRDFLLGVHCTSCGDDEPIGKPWALVPEDQQNCPVCGAIRRPDVVSSIFEGGLYQDRPLATLGVPPGEVVAVRSSTELHLFELTADIIRQPYIDVV